MFLPRASQDLDVTAGTPFVTYHGAAAAWWIPKPRSPRISLRMAARVWAVALPLTIAAFLWNWSQTERLWPFGRQVTLAPEIALRYAMIGLTYVVYVTLRSLPVWVRHRRLAKADAREIDGAIAAGQWERAGLLVHRYCLLVSAVWKRVPARVATWDAVLRPHLPRHRRLYIYYRGRPPALPQDVTASFAPVILTPPQPTLWSAAALVPVGVLLYLLVMDIARSGYWQRAMLFNAVLLTLVLASYGAYFLLMLLGRARYLRLAPGAFQILRYPAFGHRPRLLSYDLRRLHAVLDLSSPWPGLTLLDTPEYRRETYRLPNVREAIEAVLRAALSTAPTPPLPEEQLVG